MPHIMTFAVDENPDDDPQGKIDLGTHGVIAHSEHDPENDEIVFVGSQAECQQWVIAEGRGYAESNGYICEADAKHLYTQPSSEDHRVAGDRHDNDPPMDYYRSLKR